MAPPAEPELSVCLSVSPLLSVSPNGSGTDLLLSPFYVQTPQQRVNQRLAEIQPLLSSAELGSCRGCTGCVLGMKCVCLRGSALPSYC